VKNIRPNKIADTVNQSQKSNRQIQIKSPATLPLAPTKI
jgi:hypothetical protein